MCAQTGALLLCYADTVGLLLLNNCVMQVFGKDTLLAMGGESAESRQQWAEDMDLDVGSQITLCTSLAIFSLQSKNSTS